MKPKLLAFDLDGTLLTTDKTISPRTLEVLIAFQRAGGRVAIASARPAVGTAVFFCMFCCSPAVLRTSFRIKIIHRHSCG